MHHLHLRHLAFRSRKEPKSPKVQAVQDSPPLSRLSPAKKAAAERTVPNVQGSTVQSVEARKILNYGGAKPKNSGPERSSKSVSPAPKLSPSKLGNSKPDLIKNSTEGNGKPSKSSKTTSATAHKYGTYRKENGSDIFEMPSQRKPKVEAKPDKNSLKAETGYVKLQDEADYDMSNNAIPPNDDVSQAGGSSVDGFEEYDLSDLEQEEFSEYDIDDSFIEESNGEQSAAPFKGQNEPSFKSQSSNRIQDSELEQNLVSSGFESLQDDIDGVNDDKFSKSLPTAHHSAVGIADPFHHVQLERESDTMRVIGLDSGNDTLYDYATSASRGVLFKLFGSKNAKHVELQTHELKEADTQTEVNQVSEKWAQHPHIYSSIGEANSNCPTLAYTDPFKLTTFLLRAEKVIALANDNEHVRMKESNSAKSSRRKLKTPPGSGSFVLTCQKLVCSQLAKNCPISTILSDNKYLISVQPIAKKSIEKSLIVLWPVDDALNPEHLLIARSLVTSCVTDSDDLVLAGMSDGSLAVWDLSEPCHLHRQITIDGMPFVLRSPSYISACVTATGNTRSPVSSVHIVRLSDEDDSVQLVSVDELGLVTFWDIQRVFRDSARQAASSLECGMLPSSTIKLGRKVSISPPSNDLDKMRITSSATCPLLSSTVYLGTNYGRVVRVSKFSGENALMATHHDNPINEMGSAVTGVTFSPKNGSNFLASYSDGSLCLFSIEHIEPVHIWDPCDTLINEILSVQWLPSKSSSFAVLDSSPTVFLWDLDSSKAPLYSLALDK
ncbi:hypothetical protein HDE_13700 [Halotydeus destructor]|nr:hypothetical protein HDE_13700 [Halotydeus destructor]